MWFLQTDTLLLLTLLCFCFGAVSCLAKSRYRQVLRLLPLAELGFLAYVSAGFTLLYAGYILLTWVLNRILRAAKRGRGFLFALFCAVCCVPLVLSRYPGLLPLEGVAWIGIAYNMLKAIDVLYYEYYSGEKAEFEVYLNYMLFLPVLTAGPVFRYRDFLRTWERPQVLTVRRTVEGVKRVIRGLFQKVVLSALTLDLLTQLMAQELRWYHSALIPLVSLAVLYFDMAGYASIAIGMGHWMGVTVPENFKKPFQCASFTQFWRNWHVTVSDWIREHVYILFQKTKLSKWHGAAISMAVMVIMGLWHGFTMLFFVDGIFLGLLLAIEGIFGLGMVNRRKTPAWIFRLRCWSVTYLFAMNSMIFTLSTEQIGRVFRGFLTLIGGAGA